MTTDITKKRGWTLYILKEQLLPRLILANATLAACKSKAKDYRLTYSVMPFGRGIDVSMKFEITDPNGEVYARSVPGHARMKWERV